VRAVARDNSYYTPAWYTSRISLTLDGSCGPKIISASNTLCRRHRREMLPTVAAPPDAKGWM
jgi:hypothetical protein